MSTNSVTNNTGNFLSVNTDTSKIFIWENRYFSAPYNNSAYGSVTILAGTVMGRVTSTGYVKPCDSTASDGSQVPVGILAEDLIAAGGSLLNVSLCYYGDVAKEQLIFARSTDNFDTTVTFATGGTARMFDLIHRAGLRIVSTTNMTDFDN